MKIAYFDCFAGIAGDMALAALLDCGVPLDELKNGLSSLPVHGWNIETENVLRGGIHAVNARVTLDGISDEDEAAQQHTHHHAHEHEHHEHEHHEHEHHEHEHHEHAHSHQHGRSMREIREIITIADLSERVRQTSLQIFERIAKAEAYLHHSTPDEIHFHEIGGVDSLIDICGVAWCLEYLGIKEVHASALPHSSGYVDCAHGRMPVPAPATLEIAKNSEAPVQWVPTGLSGELVTPTGAGILAATARSFGAMPSLAIEKIGIGAGKKTLSDRPNLLRIVIGESVPSEGASQARSTPDTGLSPNGLEYSRLAVLECNVDDMNPELYDCVMARLFERGALDVWLQPIHMKKNRPGMLLGVLCETGRRDVMLALLLRETTTLGVRESGVLRHALPRKAGAVETKFGTVKTKIADWPQGFVHRFTPEYEDVQKLAIENDVAAQEVYAAAMAAIVATQKAS
jgi:uncharacterized protein (TIGR00299 family) protein